MARTENQIVGTAFAHDTRQMPEAGGPAANVAFVCQGICKCALEEARLLSDRWI